MAQPASTRSTTKGGQVQACEATGVDRASEEGSDRQRGTEETKTPRFRKIITTVPECQGRA